MTIEEHFRAAIGERRGTDAAVVHEYAASSADTEDAAVRHRDAAEQHRQGARDDERLADEAEDEAAHDADTGRAATPLPRE